MKAYDVEMDVLVAERAERTTLTECQVIAAALCDYFEVARLPVVRARKDATRSWFRYPYVRRHRSGTSKVFPPRIHLEDNRGYNAITVCHEVAHYVAYTRGVKGHDRTWASIYVLAVEHVLGAETASRLRYGFRKAGLLSKVVA